MNQEILRLIIFLFFIALMISGITLSFFNKTAWPTYGAAILCLIFVYLPEFKRFEGFGVKAELLDKKIEEADEIIQRLRSISLAMTEMSFTMFGQFGRWGAYIPNKDKYRLMNKIEEELKGLGADKHQIEKAEKEWHLWVNIDFSMPIINHLRKLFKDKIKQDPNNIDLKNKIKEAEKEFDKYSFYNELNKSPFFLMNYISSSEILTETEKQNIFKQFNEEFEDIKYYSKNRKFRRLEKWLNEKY